MAYWLAIGPEPNVRLGLTQKLWGMSERYNNTWGKVQRDDVVVFYVMSPIKGIVGYGTVASKMRESRPVWDREVKERTALWPLRMSIANLHVLPQTRWDSEKVPLPPLSEGITIQRSFQHLKDHLARDIIASLTARERQKS